VLPAEPDDVDVEQQDVGRVLLHDLLDVLCHLLEMVGKSGFGEEPSEGMLGIAET
jgi:hypothetical protein